MMVEKGKEWSVVYRLDSMDNDEDYFDYPSLKKARIKCEELMEMYGGRLVALDIKHYSDEEGLEDHIQYV